IFLTLSALGYYQSQAKPEDGKVEEMAPVSLTIDRTWTLQDLEDWIPRLAEGGLDLNIDAYGLDLEGNLASLVGHVTWSLGRTQDFAVKLGSIHFDYEPGKRFCMSVNDLRQNSDEGLGPNQQALNVPAASNPADLDLRIDDSWNKERLAASVRELAKQDIELEITHLREDTKGQLATITGHISFPDGASNSFDVPLGELHIVREAGKELKVTTLRNLGDMALAGQVIPDPYALQQSPPIPYPPDTVFVLVIDETWTKRELEKKIKELRQLGILLSIDILATDEDHLSALAGTISFPDGETKGFVGKLGSLVISRTDGKQIQIKMSEATPKVDFKVIIDHSYTVSSLMNKVSELAKEGIGLIPEELTVGDDGYLLALKGKIIFPNGNQANFIAEDLGEVIIESNQRSSVSVTVRPDKDRPVNMETTELISQQNQAEEADAVPSPLRQFSLGPQTTTAEWEALRQTLIEDGYEVAINEVTFNSKGYLKYIQGNFDDSEGMVAFSIDAKHYGLFSLAYGRRHEFMIYPLDQGPGQPQPAIDQGLAEKLRFTVAVSPNPSREGFTIKTTLPMRSTLRIQAYDGYGKIIEERGEGTYEAGENLFVWRPKKLSSGTYLIQVE
ncbi:MAG: hypothetical protein AAF804_15335, partial [Bacteroidota bacterium]